MIGIHLSRCQSKIERSLRVADQSSIRYAYLPIYSEFWRIGIKISGVTKITRFGNILML